MSKSFVTATILGFVICTGAAFAPGLTSEFRNARVYARARV